MKLCRFQPLLFEWNDLIGVVPPVRPEPRYGVVDGETVRELAGDLFGMWYHTDRYWRLDHIKLLPPVVPSKIVCVGRNYTEHAAELGNAVPKEPLLFLKPPSAIIGAGEPVVMPPVSKRVDHEAELGVVIGKTCAHLSDDDDAAAVILGYTCVNDITARDLQKADVQFTRAKGFDTFCPLGPVVETELDLGKATVECLVNGKRRQFAPVRDMIFDAPYLVRYISRIMTLHPGDIIATGTPAGVSPLAAGDLVEVIVSGVGALSNPVVARAE